MKSNERRMKLILMLQQATKRLTVNDIATKFNVSRRTVFRDFNVLSELNVPVLWDKYSGYGMMPGYKIPPLMFTSKELATIMVGLNFVKSQIDKTLVEDAEGVKLKIKEVLPEDLCHFMESLEEHTVVDPYLHFGPNKKGGGNWYLISSAIAQKKTISFEYENQSTQQKSHRKVDPYLLVFYHDHWNVIGYSHKREAVRNFVLQKIVQIQILENKFSPKGEIDVEQLIFRSEAKTHKIEVRIHKSALRRFEANLPAKIFKKIKKNQNIFNIQFYFDNLDFINKWLLQFATEVSVVSPHPLLKKRNQLLQKMMQSV